MSYMQRNQAPLGQAYNAEIARLNRVYAQANSNVISKRVLTEKDAAEIAAKNIAENDKIHAIVASHKKASEAAKVKEAERKMEIKLLEQENKLAQEAEKVKQLEETQKLQKESAALDQANTRMAQQQLAVSQGKQLVIEAKLAREELNRIETDRELRELKEMVRNLSLNQQRTESTISEVTSQTRIVSANLNEVVRTQASLTEGINEVSSTVERQIGEVRELTAVGFRETNKRIEDQSKIAKSQSPARRVLVAAPTLNN